MKNRTISEFMTPDPCGIDEDLPLADAVDRMLANNIRHLVVLRDGKLLGVIDSGDLALTNAVNAEAPAKIPVSEAVRGAFQCLPADKLVDVACTMERHHFGCAVVVDESGDAVGIFTLTDALRSLRTVLMGHAVEPEVLPSHRPDLPDERQQTLPRVRVKRLLSQAHAAPVASDGMTFGSVGV